MLKEKGKMKKRNASASFNIYFIEGVETTFYLSEEILRVIFHFNNFIIEK